MNRHKLDGRRFILACFDTEINFVPVEVGEIGNEVGEAPVETSHVDVILIVFLDEGRDLGWRKRFCAGDEVNVGKPSHPFVL